MLLEQQHCDEHSLMCNNGKGMTEWYTHFVNIKLGIEEREKNRDSSH